ncbi:MAG: glycosyltransferase family 39 protein [Holophagaceae bacterium]|nr:glycosyltransferase family 39 protein [Holophagaceae bacterium]
MSKKERIKFILIWLFIGVLPLLIRPLWQPDEGRYAEIPREMLFRSDWLTPYLNGVLYFEKPPFQYWLSAISMKLFGESAFVVRLPLAIATLLTMYAVWRLSKRLGSPWPLWASFAVVSCLLMYSCGQILTLDALFSALSIFSLAAVVEAVSLRYYESSKKQITGWTLVAFISAGCALLTKGPAVVVLVGGSLFFSIFFAWKDVRLRSAFFRTIFSPYGLAVFAIITVPWFVMVNMANPGHAHFFFYTEHIERFTTHNHARQGSNNAFLDKLYFVPVILLGLLPWLSASFVGMKRAIKFVGKLMGPITTDASLNKWVVVLLMASFAWPLLFFSASGSKLIPYVLPCIAPIIVLAYSFESEMDGYKPFKRSGVELLALGTVFLLSAGVLLFSSKFSAHPARWVVDLQGAKGGAWILFLGLGFVVIGLWGIRGNGLTSARWMAWHSMMLIILSFAAQAVNGSRSSINHLIARVPLEQNAQWISHGSYFQVLPFLVKDRITVVAGTGELAFGKNRLEPEEQDRWFIEDPNELTKVAWRMQSECPERPVWALSERKAWRNLEPELKDDWEVVDESSPKAVLLRLRRPFGNECEELAL